MQRRQKTGTKRHGQHTFKSHSTGRNRTAVYRCSPSAGPARGRRDGVCKNKTGGSKIVGTGKRPFLWEKYYAKVRLPEGKTFEQATGHEKTGTLQDWIQFEPKENKSCVIEQKQRENEREDIRHPADGKRLQLQKPRHTATSQNKIQEAVLDYQVIRQGEGSALLDITLHTGRHHQIRVQLAHLGTPICGDHKYGKAERGTPALCSYHIDFVHPVSGKEMTYEISPRNFETEC